MRLTTTIGLDSFIGHESIFEGVFCPYQTGPATSYLGQLLQGFRGDNLWLHNFGDNQIWLENFLWGRWGFSDIRTIFSRIYQRQLEGDSSSYPPPVLSNNHTHHRQDNKISWWGRISAAVGKEWNSIRHSIKSGFRQMKQIEIGPNKLYRVEFSAFERSASASYKMVGHVHVESTVPISTFILDTDGLNDFFQRGKASRIYAGDDDKLIHDFTIEDIYKTWYLLMANFNFAEKAAVYYRVEFEKSK